MIKLALVDDHPIVRTGLETYLNAIGTFNVCIAAASKDELLPYLENNVIDVALIDVQLGTSSGIALSKQLREQFPDLKILILSSSAYPEDVRQAFAYGVHGYQLKEAAAQTIAANIEAIHRGEMVIHPKLLPFLVEKEPSTNVLTNREQEIVDLIAEGQTNRDIAQSLYISEATVKTHVSNILSKLEVNDRTGIAIWAFKNTSTRMK